MWINKFSLIWLTVVWNKDARWQIANQMGWFVDWPTSSFSYNHETTTDWRWSKDRPRIISFHQLEPLGFRARRRMTTAADDFISRGLKVETAAAAKRKKKEEEHRG